MIDKIDYEYYFNEALKIIAISRNPQAERKDDIAYGIPDHFNDSYFDFGLSKLENNRNTIMNAKKNSYICVAKILSELLRTRKIEHQVNFDVVNPTAFSPIEFAIYDIKASTIFFFKDIEKEYFFTMNQKDILLSKELKEKLLRSEIKEYKVIYFSFDEKQRQVMNSNNNLPLMTIKEFFDIYSSIDEYDKFLTELQKYTEKIYYCIEHIQLKPLTSNANLNFKRLVKHRLENFDALEVLINSKGLEKSQYDTLKSEYEFLKLKPSNQGWGSLVYGSEDFSESLITAEWLFESMKKAKAVDLSVIGISYFKSVEQLMYQIMALNVDKGYKYKMSRNSELIELTQKTLNENITIGAMALFIKYSLAPSFYDELKELKNYILNSFIGYVNLRNEYAHKHNIHDWDKIIEIREKTLSVFFFLLTSIKFSVEDKKRLGVKKCIQRSEYEKLCEYLDYHRNQVFIFEYSNNEVDMGISCVDTKAEIMNDNYVKYSGAYFKRLGNGTKCILREENLPSKIYIGMIDIKLDSEYKFNFEPRKISLIFDSGKFCGPSIIEENHNSY